jgi:outer membrane biosynthesis protein TonB
MDDRSMSDQFHSKLSSKVDQQVRALIGELQMQLIVMKSMMEVAQGQQEQERPISQPTRQVPNPQSPEPVPAPVTSPPQQDPIPTPKPPPQQDPRQQAQRVRVNTNGARIHEVGK